MWKCNSPDELYHYGVKGMKWGKHKKRSDDDIGYRRVTAGSKYDGFVVSDRVKNGYYTGEHAWNSAFANPHVAYGTHGSGTRYRKWKQDVENATSKQNSNGSIGEYRPVTGESGASRVDFNKLRQQVNGNLKRQDSNLGKVLSEGKKNSLDLDKRVRESKRQKAAAPKKLKKRRPGSAAEVQRRTQKALKKIGKMRMQAK